MTGGTDVSIRTVGVLCQMQAPTAAMRHRPLQPLGRLARRTNYVVDVVILHAFGEKGKRQRKA